VTTVAAEAGRRAWGSFARARVWLETAQPAKLLVPAILVQWLSVLGLALTVRHNGWLYYQGGDQLWYYDSGWLLRHGLLPTTLVGFGWPALLAPMSLIGGPTLVPALPVIVLFDVLVLLPVALLCVYGIGERIGGRLFGYWATAVWLAAPYVGIKFTDALYHQRYTELTLPQSFGLTSMADFPSMVAVLVSVYFVFRVIDRPDVVEAIAAGLAAGVAIGIKPSNSIFLLGVVLGLLYRRRFVVSAYFAAGLVPSLLILTLWKYRGLGYLPAFRSEGPATRLALGAHQQLVAFNPLQKYVHFDWHQLNLNLLAIKEHFWSMRVIEWLVIAGLIGLFRRSVTAGLVVGGWFAAFVLAKATYPHASIDDASVFRIMMPSFPAFVLMISSLVFLFPGRWRSMRVPLPRGYVVDGLLRTVDPSLNLTATVSGGRVLLRWNPAEPAGTRVFYRIWRSNAPNGGASCTPAANAPDDCELVMDDLGAHPGGAWVDRPGTGTWTYRLGLAANWLDSPDYGDVYSIGPPVTVRVR